MDVLMSIKPEFADLIFNGTKKYEYRKAIFKNTEIDKIIVYASSPVKKIIGELRIDHIICDKPSEIWRRTRQHSGVNKKFFFEYFIRRQLGYAIKIKSAGRYKAPIDPYQELENFKAPQSFMYVNDPALKKTLTDNTP